VTSQIQEGLGAGRPLREAGTFNAHTTMWRSAESAVLHAAGLSCCPQVPPWHRRLFAIVDVPGPATPAAKSVQKW
jgi:hypothetical protein